MDAEESFSLGTSLLEAMLCLELEMEALMTGESISTMISKLTRKAFPVS